MKHYQLIKITYKSIIQSISVRTLLFTQINILKIISVTNIMASSIVFYVNYFAEFSIKILYFHRCHTGDIAPHPFSFRL